MTCFICASAAFIVKMDDRSNLLALVRERQLLRSSARALTAALIVMRIVMRAG
jgi:hypothetical protein